MSRKYYFSSLKRVFVRSLGTLLIAGCALGSVSPAEPGKPERPAAPVLPASPLALLSAETNYYASGPADQVVEIRIIVDNLTNEVTQNTSIAWEPAFADRFMFLDSEPKPWRVRRDERGWGVLDTAGVLPAQHGMYRLWFAASSYAIAEPRITVVANSGVPVADVTARASHLRWTAPPAAQQTFERGPVAQLTSVSAVLPTGPRWLFIFAMALSVVLTGVVVGGSALTLRRMNQAQA